MESGKRKKNEVEKEKLFSIRGFAYNGGMPDGGLQRCAGSG